MGDLRSGENEAASVIDAARKVVDAELRIRRESHPGIERSKLSDLEHTRSHYIDMLGLDLLLLDKALQADVKTCASCGATWTEDTLWCSECQKVTPRGELRSSDTPAVCAHPEIFSWDWKDARGFDCGLRWCISCGAAKPIGVLMGDWRLPSSRPSDADPETMAGVERSANARSLSPIAGCCGGTERHTATCREPMSIRVVVEGDDGDRLVPVRLGQPDVERERESCARIAEEIDCGDEEASRGFAWRRETALTIAQRIRERGVSAPNPEAGPTGLDLVELGRVEPAPREEKEAPWMVNGRPIEVDDDDDDARGWMVNGRPVSPRDVDHGDAQAEAENPWTVNGAPIPELPRRVDHAKCKANLEAERARYRRALGLLVDVSSVARKVVGYVDQEAETKR